MAFPLPSWLNVQPALFTQALEAGARAGLAVSEQQQRAFALAEARAERQARDAERQREFEETRLLNVQRLGQQAAELAQLGDYRQQQARHQAAQEANQAAQESRLLTYQQGQLGYDAGRLALEKQRLEAASQLASTKPVWVPAVEGGAPGHFELPGGRVSTPSIAKPEPVGKLSDVDKSRLRALDSEASALRSTVPFTSVSNPAYAAGTNRLALIPQEREAILSGGGSKLAAPTLTGRIKPLPKVKADLVTDDFYDIKGTVYRWDGTNFKRVPTR